MKKRKPGLEIGNDVDRFINVKKRKPRLENDMDFIKVKENLGHHLSREDAEDDKELVSRHVTHGFHLVQGKMDHGMEDYIVAENRKVNGHELGLYAIFDGHSGRDVAEYLQSHLFDNILSEPDFWTNPKDAVKRAYKATDDDILEMMIGSRGGSTAVTATLIDQEKLIIANVGDSRAILCRNGQAKQISVDHEPHKEKELVESRGGFVSKAPGNVPRVDGQLAMTRAFGDVEVKEHITSEPYVRVESVDKDSEFIILASDGLWKVMSNKEALECIRKIDDAQEASKKLVREALSRKSNDDISCVIVMFH
nr:probable protein phosphatase 2C 58 isoform X1 [Ziziphus jujuba var. spinosa]